MTNAEARFNKSHIRRGVCVFSCNLPPALFGRMTGIFLLATVVTRGWNGYRNKSQHRKSTLEKKILPPFQQGFEPAIGVVVVIAFIYRFSPLSNILAMLLSHVILR